MPRAATFRARHYADAGGYRPVLSDDTATIEWHLVNHSPDPVQSTRRPIISGTLRGTPVYPLKLQYTYVLFTYKFPPKVYSRMHMLNVNL